MSKLPNDGANSNRKRYLPPELIKYGSVQDLALNIGSYWSRDPPKMRRRNPS